ncbi:tetratricopeptide repeat-containing sulfotransferase family protein [Shimia abyssi]|uniref:Sulfotransferase family protein n=1 Tax=Shimia abyssi TaxID=1662395 RepID=A0A2P8F773_9RHOB|nr:sulfotransferase [Shimia abyssi]PSL17571.1 sulfotransferase family protein [Shimia abyssi]
MLDERRIVTELPSFPDEVTLFQAVGILGTLDRPKNQSQLMERTSIHDPVVRVWALSSLIAKAARVDGNLLVMAMHVARRSAHLRQLLLPRFLSTFRFDLVNKLQELEEASLESEKDLHLKMMEATLQNDYEAQVLLHERLYLMTGNPKHVTDARDIARSRLNWSKALKPMLRAIFTHTEPLQASLIGLLRMLEREDARDQFKLFAQVIRPNEEARLASIYAFAQMHYWDKQYQKCIQVLEKSNALKLTKDKLSILNALVANAYEKDGDYENAAKWYQLQNEALKQKNLKPERYIADLENRAGWPVPKLPEDKNDNYFIMTGFPRSGTTLLENALSSHPKVMACEETSSLIGSIFTAYKSPMSADPDGKNIGLRGVAHRQLYYQNLTRYVNKPDVQAIIDKTPIIGSNIKYMEKIFPSKKYIFSIRHPYDVVLSNWKQDYAQNIAMTAFNDIHTSCVLYNHVMSDWFEVFPGKTDRVYYIKYDELVNDFDAVIGGALDFLGVEWTDEVRNFAENASKRAVRTPSYANVRKGLSLGVQSSWQNFEFLFDEECRKLLDPWVERFEYAA